MEWLDPQETNSPYNTLDFFHGFQLNLEEIYSCCNEFDPKVVENKENPSMTQILVIQYFH